MLNIKFALTDKAFCALLDAFATVFLIEICDMRLSVQTEFWRLRVLAIVDFAKDL
jgi:hypothetical protein